MPYSNSIPSPSTTSASTSMPTSCGPRFWAMIPEGNRSAVLGHHRHRARQIIAEEGFPVPNDQDRLELIVTLAVEAEILFFDAALFEPTQEERDLFFADFLRRALAPSSVH